MSSLFSVTVAICTYNRSDLLRQTLKSLARLSIPADVEWEVVVVDNNSTDDTNAVLTELEGSLPLRSALEPRSGKSFAANTAVKQARGELILWTDDDVIVASDWLHQYCAAFRDHPDVGIFGGPIEPWFEGEPPGWLERAFPLVANAYAALDLGDRVMPLSHDAYPYGANMALKKNLHLTRPFDTRIGPNPVTVMRGEEMVLVRELLADGEKGLWIPTARVQHYIPQGRQSIGYLRSYYVAAGRLLDYLGDAPGRLVLGRPLWMWRQALVSELRYRLHRPFGKPERWIEDLRAASVGWGRLRGYPTRTGDAAHDP